MSLEEKYIEASPRAKWVLILFLIAISIIGMNLYQAFNSIKVPDDATVEELETITSDYQNLTRYTTIVNFLLALGLSPYFIQLGYRTLKHGEYPPPKTTVVLRSKIVGGRLAVFSAIGCFVVGILVWAGFAFGLFMEYLFHEFT